MRDNWKAFLKKAWTNYKFVMTDKQPFRDKLVIPTQSIQIFLQSMTHVGLANVGNLLALSGHLPNTKGMLEEADLGRGWDVVGTKLALKKSKYIGGSKLNADLEDEIIKYLMHLVKGGGPFDHKDTAIEKRPRSASRTTPVYIDQKGTGTFMVRRKKAYTTSSPSRRKIDTKEYQIAEAERKSLRLDIPPSPLLQTPGLASPSTPLIVDARPHFDISDDELSEPQRRHSEAETASTRQKQSMPQEQEHDRTRTPTLKSTRHNLRADADVRSYRRDCRSQVEGEIRRGQEEVAREMANAQKMRRSLRRMSQLHEPESRSKLEESVDTDSGNEDVIIMLEEQYGLGVEKLANERAVVDNGTVIAVVPASLAEPDDAEDTAEQYVLPKRGARLISETSLYDRSLLSKRSRHTRPNYQPSTTREVQILQPQSISIYQPYMEDYESGQSEPERPQSVVIETARRSGPDVIIHDHDEQKAKTARRQLRQETAPLGESLDFNVRRSDASG